jgi:hypothetical protein
MLAVLQRCETANFLTVGIAPAWSAKIPNQIPEEVPVPEFDILIGGSRSLTTE